MSNKDEKATIPENQICMEEMCEHPAVTDYNGHGHFVCVLCYDSLSRYFDEEYR